MNNVTINKLNLDSQSFRENLKIILSKKAMHKFRKSLINLNKNQTRFNHKMQKNKRKQTIARVKKNKKKKSNQISTFKEI